MASAQNPDLNDYVVLKTLDFSGAHWDNQSTVTMVTGASAGTVSGTAVNDITTPSEFSGYLALQGANNGSGNGWWLRASNGGLWAYGAGRVGKVYNLKEGFIVKITCTQAAANVLTLVDADGNYTSVTSDDGNSYYCTMVSDGYVGFSGAKSSGYISSITIYAPAGALLPPTGELTNVTEAGKTYTIANPNGRGTLYYTASVDTNGEEAPSVGNTAYSSTEETSVDITISESGNLYAYVSNGSSASDIVTIVVDATKETLNAPEITMSGMAGTDEVYYPVVNIAHTVVKVGDFTPTVTLSYDLDGTDVTSSVSDGKYTFPSTGTLTVKATAEGYVENSTSYAVAFPYSKDKVIDIASITEEDVNTDYWTKNDNETTTTQWNFNDAVNYSLASDEYVKTALEGITLWWDESLKPMLYIGKGLMWPYGGANNKNISYTDGTEDQIIFWTYLNNYGASVLTAITAGNEPYALYRFSNMLQKVEAYSPNIPTVTVTIGKTGYSTFASTEALNLDQLPEGLTAYYAATDAVSEDGESVVLTPATGKVRVGEGLILAGEADAKYEIPVAATGNEIDGNLLVGRITETADMISGENRYVLVDNGGTAEFQSLATNPANVPVGKAYLELPEDKTAASRLRISFGDEDGTANAIETVEKPAAADGIYYNLAGQRVQNPVKGIYIVNGQKVLVK